MTPAPIDVSVVISTRNRAESLRATLETLASADRQGIRVEVIVVDNGGDDATETVAVSFASRIPLRFFREPTVGKPHALKRGVPAAKGEIIAVLDDDMSVDGRWFQAVVDMCRRHPGKDIFGGSTRIVWPTDAIPDWARNPRITSEIFSAGEFYSEADLESGMWFSGNHFWFRSRLLALGVEFDDVWVSEPKFQLDLVEKGCRGVYCPAAIADHRVQAHLLRPDVVMSRARRAGIVFAALRLVPYRSHVRSARMMHEHPLLTRAYCLVRWIINGVSYSASLLHSVESERFARRVFAANRMTLNGAYIRVANRHAEYSLRSRVRKRAIAA